MKAYTTIRLADITMSVVAESDTETQAHITVVDNTTEATLSSVIAYTELPIVEFARTDNMARMLYLHTNNTENALSAQEREQIRDFIVRGNPDAEWLKEGTYRAFYKEGSVTGSMIIVHQDGVLVSTRWGVHCAPVDVDYSVTLDFSNGPIGFTAELLKHPEFFEGITKAAQYNLTHQ